MRWLTFGEDPVAWRPEASLVFPITKSESDADLYELNKDYTVVGSGGPGNRAVLIASEAGNPLFGRSAFRVMNVSDAAVDVRTGASGSTLAQSTRVRDDLASRAIYPYQDIPAGNMRSSSRTAREPLSTRVTITRSRVERPTRLSWLRIRPRGLPD